MKITEVTTGHSLICWMRPGAPLTLHRSAKGKLTYRQVNHVVKQQKPGMFLKFAAQVQSNDTASKILTVTATPIWNQHDIAVGKSLTARIHYSTLKRVHLISQFSHEGDPTFPLNRPTKVDSLGLIAKKPYKTATKVEL